MKVSVISSWQNVTVSIVNTLNIRTVQILIFLKSYIMLFLINVWLDLIDKKTPLTHGTSGRLYEITPKVLNVTTLIYALSH